MDRGRNRENAFAASASGSSRHEFRAGNRSLSTWRPWGPPLISTPTHHQKIARKCFVKMSLSSLILYTCTVQYCTVEEMWTILYCLLISLDKDTSSQCWTYLAAVAYVLAAFCECLVDDRERKVLLENVDFFAHKNVPYFAISRYRMRGTILEVVEPSCYGKDIL